MAILKSRAKITTAQIPGRERSDRSGSQIGAVIATARLGSGMNSAAMVSPPIIVAPVRNEVGQSLRPASQINSPPAVNIATRYAAIRAEFATPSSRVVVD